LWNTGMGCPER